MTDAEILRSWNTLSKQTYTEARVFSCVISAFENNNEIVTKRATAVMKVVWPENAVLGVVPSEIRGDSANQNQNRLRQADFARLMQLVSLESERLHPSLPEQPSVVLPDARPPASADTSTETASVDGEAPVASDLDPPPADRVVTTVSRVVRDTELAKRIKVLHRQLCQLCGETVRLADGAGYAEGHHLKPLGRPHDGPDVAENIVCLCPNHHAACDLGAIQLNVSDFRSARGHVVGQRFIDYHNRVVYRGASHAEAGDAPGGRE